MENLASSLDDDCATSEDDSSSDEDCILVHESSKPLICSPEQKTAGPSTKKTSKRQMTMVDFFGQKKKSNKQGPDCSRGYFRTKVMWLGPHFKAHQKFVSGDEIRSLD